MANVSFGSSFELKCPGNVTVSRDISWFWLNAGTPGRVPPERAKEDGLSLHFHTLDDSARGWYRCKYNIGETQRCFEFNLQNKGKFISLYFLTFVFIKLHTFQWRPSSLLSLCAVDASASQRLLPQSPQ